jgi:hypothetical protein
MRLFATFKQFPIFAVLVLCAATDSVAQGAPCPQGLKGKYVTWSKTSAAAGAGSFSAPTGQVAVLPGFTWEVTGMPLSINVADDEPFGGGNSMQDIYGSAVDATNLNIRIQPNGVSSGSPIPHSVLLTIRFDANTPASGWGFSLVDIDVDQVRFRAKDSSGANVPVSTLAGWFIQRFDANPATDGVNLPAWDDQMAAVIGSESSSTVWRTTVEGGLDDTEAGAAWFQPDISLSELSFEYQSLQGSANPSYHVLVAACLTDNVAPTPTPSSTGDSDNDTIPDATEGSGDPDNDHVPNYLDKDSDNDTIPDSTEGTGDPDGDDKPNYVDRDSDGDNVSDEIERDPEATTDTSTGQDENQDGIDDGDSDRTNTPVDDTDGDSTPNHLDSDSDNDNQGDGDEAYDLDGDGERDVTESSKDTDDNGLDDAFEDFDSPQDLNPKFIGKDNTSRCTSVATKRTKKSVRSRMTALANRVPMFSKRARACGGQVPSDLSTSAQAESRSMEQRLARDFPDRSLVCPVSVCVASSASQSRTALLASAKQLFTHAKTAKLLAIKACGASPDTSTRRRPSTETYHAQLRREITKLPRRLSSCDSSARR